MIRGTRGTDFDAEAKRVEYKDTNNVAADMGLVGTPLVPPSWLLRANHPIEQSGW